MTQRSLDRLARTQARPRQCLPGAAASERQNHVGRRNAFAASSLDLFEARLPLVKCGRVAKLETGVVRRVLNRRPDLRIRRLEYNCC
jgi:hypothetical protein